MDASTNALLTDGDAARANYSVQDGVVRHSSGASFSYGQLAQAAAQLTPPASAPLPHRARRR